MGRPGDADEADANERPGRVDRGRLDVPAHLTRDSVEALTAERYTRTPIVYLALIAIVTAGLVSLPLVHVPVAVRAPGMVRPAAARYELRAGTSGVIELYRMSEGQRVEAGALLMRVAAPALTARASQVMDARRELLAAIADLESLVSIESTRSDSAAPAGTRRYREELRLLARAIAEHTSRGDRIREEQRRAERLLAGGLIAPTEVQRLRYAASEEDAAGERTLSDFRARWARDLVDARARLRELEGERAALAAEERARVLRAPTGGTLESVAPLAVGSFVTVGEPLGSLAPPATLRVEARLGPDEVVLVRPGAPALVRVDGYPPGEWGLLPGRVLSIAEDFELVGGRPVFRTVIELDRQHLSLPNGRVGSVRKGVTAEVRIVVARPTLYELLRRNLNDLIHPREPGG